MEMTVQIAELGRVVSLGVASLSILDQHVRWCIWQDIVPLQSVATFGIQKTGQNLVLPLTSKCIILSSTCLTQHGGGISWG